MNPMSFVTQMIRIAVPYLFAAGGGVIAERSGIITLSLEGYMLSGAFAATLGAHYSGSPWIGVLCGISGGLIFGLIHAIASIRYRADQVVTGIAINLLAIGVTRFFLKLAFASSSNSPRINGFGGNLAFHGFDNPLLWMGLLVAPLLAFLVYRTPLGLRMRAVGEHPAAAESLGIRAAGIQYVAVAISAMLAALGGVFLALDQHQFTDQMTAGRGFIAVAAVIFGRWDPVRGALACLLFAAAETLQIQLQGNQIIPSQFIEMIPYLLTIIALAGVVGRAIPPAALGRSAE